MTFDPGQVIALYRPSMDGPVTGPHRRIVKDDDGSRVRFESGLSMLRGPEVSMEPWSSKHDDELLTLRSR